MSFDLDALQSITAAYDKQELDRLHTLWKKARKDAKRKQHELELIKRQREMQDLHAQRQHEEVLQRSQQELDRLRAELASAHQREQQLRDQRRSTRASIKSLTEDLLHTQEIVKTKEQDLETQFEKNTRLASMLDTLIKQREEWLHEEAAGESRAQKELQARAALIEQQEATIRQLTARVEGLETDLRAQREKTEQYQAEAEQLTKQKSELAHELAMARAQAQETQLWKAEKQKLEADKSELHRLLSAEYRNNSELAETASRLRRRETEVAQLQTRVKEAEARKCEVCDTLQTRVRTLDTESDVLKKSNERLVQLLASTHEHRQQFLPMSTAGGADGDARCVFLPSAEPPGQTFRGARSMVGDILDGDKRREAMDNDTADYAIIRKHESDYWIPCEIFRLMNEFLASYLPGIRASLFYEILIAINRVWKNKEARTVELATAPLKREVQELKRKLLDRTAPSVDERAVRSDLELLKRNIETSKFRHVKGQEAISGGGRALQTALKYLEALLKKLSFYQSENDVLRDQVASLQGGRPGMDDYRRDEARRDDYRTHSPRHGDVRPNPALQANMDKTMRVLEAVLTKLQELCDDFESCVDSAFCYDDAHSDQAGMYLDMHKDFLETLRAELGRGREDVLRGTRHWAPESCALGLVLG
uniref:Uncharacterized protein n=1 Tax=Eutreptiella gymnastica TaxID=73025 RepID=A0A7S1NT26_9EUGL|mmetsp:Transcript_8152/g.14510  ORF Transcript_8152/g.14510 Transcript_8152/m.14510 type:complete len:653 (+) Transcript_8152:115-2073(+)